MDPELAKEDIEVRDAGSPSSSPPPPPEDRAFSRKQLRRYETGYFLSTFAIGPPFASFVTYVGFQIQTIGYAIGHEPGAAGTGTGCPPTATSCRVPLAGSGDVNLTSYLLYLNAIVYAVGGGLTLVVSGVGDRLGRQREQYVAQLVLYGALALPAAGLGGGGLATFDALSGLYVVFNVVGFVAGAWMNIFIPYVMRGSGESRSPISPSSRRWQQQQQGSANDRNADRDLARKAIADGMRMSVWGANGLSAGSVVLYVVSIGLTFVSATSGGLYTTTASGVLCIVVSIVAWRLLPAPEPRLGRGEGEEGMAARDWLMLPLTTFSRLFRQVWECPESFKFLLAYTVYTDTQFALSAVTGQLFNLTIRPSLREFTYYSLVQPAAAIAGATAFLHARPATRDGLGLTLRRWTAVCYALTCLAAVWCAVGMSAAAPVGFKRRWEFYVFQALQSAAAGVAGVAFRVLFSRLFPAGREIQFFGFQLVLSLGTVWIPQIVNGPIVDATNNLRLPAAISAVFLLACVVLTLLVDEEKGMRQVGYENTGD